MEIDIGEKLRGEVADRQAPIFGCIEKRFLSGYQRPQLRTALCDEIVDNVIEYYFFGKPEDFRTSDSFLNEAEQDFPFHAHEEASDVQMQEPGLPSTVRGDFS